MTELILSGILLTGMLLIDEIRGSEDKAIGVMHGIWPDKLSC